jgi:HlyD family secretion protein
MKHITIKLWLVLILITLISVACDLQQPTPIVASEDATEIYPEISWNFGPVIEFVGYVVPANDYYLSFPTSGQIFELNVQAGDVVQAGDQIAILDATIIKSDIARAEADLALAKAELELSKLGSHPALIEEAESKVELAEAVRPVGVAQETAQIANVKGAQARLEYLKTFPIPEDVILSEAEVNRREVALETARLRLNQTYLVAPIDGTILQVYIKKYEYAGIGRPVLRLSNLEILQLEIVVDDLEIGNIKLGDQATITFDVLPDVELTGDVISIQPENLDRMSGNFIVTLSLPDHPESISLGMSANIGFDEK